MSSHPIDLGQLQAQLELDRSSLANSILSKLPSIGPSPSSHPIPSLDPTQAKSRPANLGVGAKSKQTQQIQSGSTSSAQDLRLRGQLTTKRRRADDSSLNRNPKALDHEPEDEDQHGRASVISSKKSRRSSTIAGQAAQTIKKDPFATKGIEAQKAMQSQSNLKQVDGETVDVSKLSKAQRKRLNKKLKDRSESGTAPQEASSSSAMLPPILTRTEASSSSPATESTKDQTAVSKNPSATLTSLQAQMLSKLSGSRFRTINEKLYTTDSQQAVKMIDESPAMFDEYHQGFREQVKTWPNNPLDRIVEMLDPQSSFQSASHPSRTKKPKATAAANVDVTTSKFTSKSKARYTPSALVIDLGAGEGGLAKKLVPKGVKVLSFDLINTLDGWVRRQDTASIGGLPLPGFFDPQDPVGLHSANLSTETKAPGVVDVAVFCLSLMGTNWIQMILEAKRVLREGGELIIAEVSSRFENFDDFVSLVQQVGFGLENQDNTNSHFVLFEFVKLPCAHAGQQTIGTEVLSLQDLTQQAKHLLKPCLYKRR